MNYVEEWLHGQHMDLVIGFLSDSGIQSIKSV